MSIFDQFAPALAKTLIDDADIAGKAATIRRPGSGGEYDPATGTITGGNPDTDYPCKVVLQDVEDREIDGTLIELGDKKAFVSAQTIGITPQPNSDVLILGTDPDASSAETWEIVKVGTTPTGESDALYTVFVRR